MSELTRYHPGDTVYCLDSEGIPLKGHIIKLTILGSIVTVLIHPDEWAIERDPMNKWNNISDYAVNVYPDYDSLVDAQITKYRDKIKYWEELRSQPPGGNHDKEA